MRYPVAASVAALLLLAVGAHDANGQTPPSPPSAEDALDKEAKQAVDFGLGGADSVSDYGLFFNRSGHGPPRISSFITDLTDGFNFVPPFFVTDGRRDGARGQSGVQLTRWLSPLGSPDPTRERVWVYTDIGPETWTGFDDNDLNTYRKTAVLVDPADGRDMAIPAYRPELWAGKPETHTLDRTLTTPGTFRGVEGQFRCGGTEDCSVTAFYNPDESVGYHSLAGKWQFIPDEVRSSDSVEDTDYYWYGAWLKTSHDGDGTLRAYDEVQTFTGSSLDPVGRVAEIVGKAYYKGGAAGIYVKDGVTGNFTADAELDADFGTDTIYGWIGRFSLDGRLLYGWELELWDTDIEADGTFEGETDSLTNGHVWESSGSYSGTFHGTNHDGPAPPPAQVIGEFDATFRNGSVAGAFGARTEPRKAALLAIYEVDLPPPSTAGFGGRAPDGDYELIVEADGDELKNAVGVERGGSYRAFVWQRELAAAFTDAGEYLTLAGTQGVEEAVAVYTDILDGREAVIDGETVPDYLHYGYWLTKTVHPDGGTDFNEIQTFAGSSLPPSGDVRTVTGEANYTGGAGGFYARAGKTGQFHGTATLTADFDDNTITGAIYDMRFSNDPGLQWMVEFRGGTIDAEHGSFAGDAVGIHGSQEFDGGGFGGRFQSAGDTGPDTATGEFTARFEGGGLAGGFGARKQN